MSQQGIELLLNSFSVSAVADPIHQSLWVYVDGQQLFSDGYSSLTEWGAAVRGTVCDNYAANNNNITLPDACAV